MKHTMQKTVPFLLAALTAVSLIAMEVSAAPPKTVIPKNTEVSETVSEAEKGEEPELLVPLHAVIRTDTMYADDPETWQSLCQISQASVLLADEDAEAFPALQKTLEKQVEATLKQLEETCGEFSALNDPDSYFSLDSSAEIVRADSRVLSVRFFSTASMGEREDFTRTGQTFDTATGKELALGDIVTDEELLKKILIEELESRFGDSVGSDLDEPVSDFLENASGWVLTPVGLEFYVDPSGLVAISEDRMTVPIAFTAYPELFKEEYTACAESFVLPLCIKREQLPSLEYDLGGDGSINVITYVPLETDHEEFADDYNGFTIAIDGRECAVQADPFSVIERVCLVHTASGKDLLFFFTDSEYQEFDTSSVSVVDLTNETAALLSGADGSLYSVWEWDDGEKISSNTSTEDAFTDPEKLRLTTLTDVLSTYGVWKTYRTAKNGKLTAVDALAHARENPGFRLTLKKDYTAEEVDEAGNITGSLELDAGTGLVIFRTDDYCFADLKTPDEKLVRITLDLSDGADWGATLDGENIDDLFDGLLFAG